MHRIITELMHLFAEHVELICVEFNENRKVRIGLVASRRVGLALVCPADAAVAHKCLTDGPSVHQADKQQRRRVLFNVSVELCVCSRQAGSSRLALIKILRIRTVNELGKYMYVCVCV